MIDAGSEPPTAAAPSEAPALTPEQALERAAALQTNDDLDGAIDAARAGIRAAGGPDTAAGHRLRAALAHLLWARGDTAAALAEFEALLPVDDDAPEIDAALRRLVGLNRALGLLGAALRHGERRYRLQRQRRGDDDPQTQHAALALADLRRAAGDAVGARALEHHWLHDGDAVAIDRALHCAERWLGDGVPASVIALLAPLAPADTLPDENERTRQLLLAAAYRENGDLATAATLQTGLVATLVRILGEEHPYTLCAHADLGDLERRLGQFEAAKATQALVLDQCRRLLDPLHPEYLSALNNLGGTLWLLGEYEDAHKLQQEACEGYRRTLGLRHPNTLTALGNLSETERALGRYEAARALQAEMLEPLRATCGDEALETQNARAALAETLQSLGDHRAAAALYRQAWEGRQRQLGVNHPEVLVALGNLAAAEFLGGEADAALQTQAQLHERLRTTLGADHPDTLAAAANLAGLCAATGELTRARQLQTEALASWQRQLGVGAADTQRAAWDLYRTLLALGDANAAIALRRQQLGGLEVLPAETLAPDLQLIQEQLRRHPI